MIKMRALKDFESMDGAFAEGDTFHVNEERAQILTRTERAALAPPDIAETGAADDSESRVEAPAQHAADEAPVALGVPKRQPE